MQDSPRPGNTLKLWTGFGVIWLCCSTFYFWLIDFQISAPVPTGYYGHQTEAFLSGQLHLKIPPHPMLAELENPYHGDQNRPYRILDLSYYKGKYYSYFGIGPIVGLTLPWRLITGTYLTEPGATAVLASACGLASALVLLFLRKIFHPRLPAPVVLAAYVTMLLGGFAASHLTGGINPGTVAQQAATLCLLLAFLFLLHALQGPRPGGSLAWLSLACGAAVACRPSFVPITVMIPVAFLFLHVKRRLPLRTLLICGALPISAIAFGLCWYNYLRFASVIEFGNRYQLTDLDTRNVALIAPDYFRQRWLDLILKPVLFSRYFPFIAHQNDLHPIGLVWACPVFLLSIGTFFGWRRPPALRIAEAALLVSFLGIFCFLAAYRFFLFHYEIDFFVPGILAGLLGWFALLHHFQHRTGAFFLVACLGTALCAFSVFTSMGYTLALTRVDQKMPGVTRGFNALVHRVDGFRNVGYGTLKLRLKLPGNPRSQREPLVTTGRNAHDVCYVVYEPESRIRIGLFHAGAGGPLSEPIAIDPQSVQELDLQLGSFLPPPAHPFFDNWTPEAVRMARNLLRVSLNGQIVVQGNLNFHASSPDRVHIGKNDALVDVSAPQFTGEILSTEWQPARPGEWTAFQPIETGAARATLRLPASVRNTGVDPLLSLGDPGRADLIFVRYLPDGHIALGIDHWGEMHQSLPIKVTTGELHELIVVANGLGTPATATDHFALILNGKTVLRLNLRTHLTAPNKVFWGWNACESSVSSPVFGGTILAVEPVVPPSGEDILTITSPGVVNLGLRFQRAAIGRSLPLIVSGSPGAADFLYVQVVDENHVRFGFDHWGIGGRQSELIPVDLSQNQQVEIIFGALFVINSPSHPEAGKYEVRLNGQTVLSGESPFHPTDFSRIYIAQNPIGGSTTGTEFLGEILSCDLLELKPRE